MDVAGVDGCAVGARLLSLRRAFAAHARTGLRGVLANPGSQRRRAWRPLHAPDDQPRLPEAGRVASLIDRAEMQRRGAEVGFKRRRRSQLNFPTEGCR